MRILGFDPGLATTGFGLIDSDGQRHRFLDGGVILTPKDLSLAERLLMIHTEVSQLVKTTKPDVFSVEKIFFNTNVTSAINVSQARGALVLSLAQAGQPTFEYTPLQIKTAITGFGRAGKQQIQAMVKNLLQLQRVPQPDDCADALAVALTTPIVFRNRSQCVKLKELAAVI